MKEKLALIRAFLKNKYFKFAYMSLLYILFVIWLGNFIFLLGLGVIYDMYVSKKVNWTFWKKREGKNHKIVEWLDALIFAVLAVTFINIFFFQNYKIPTGSMEKSLLRGDHLFVSKLTYGPRIPQTPLHFPFAQNTMPLIKTKSYLTWIQWPYKRLKGLKEIERDDVVVFNFPAGDTVVLQYTSIDYDAILREEAMRMTQNDLREGKKQVKSKDYYFRLARENVWRDFDVAYRPVDRRDNYIKRCVAIAGDTIEIKETQLYVNSEKQAFHDGIQFKYRIYTEGYGLNKLALDKMGIPPGDVEDYGEFSVVALTEQNLKDVKSISNVTKVERIEKPDGFYNYRIFPHHVNYPWNEDNFGPLVIPKKGMTVNLSLDNLPLYERIIQVYEENTLAVKNGIIYINGEEATQYTFKMNYYWLMGDNRHDSLDSRFWGFVPDDHIVGSPVFIWLSVDKTKSSLKKIRWSRLFTGIH